MFASILLTSISLGCTLFVLLIISSDLSELSSIEKSDTSPAEIPPPLIPIPSKKEPAFLIFEVILGLSFIEKLFPVTDSIGGVSIFLLEYSISPIFLLL